MNYHIMKHSFLDNILSKSAYNVYICIIYYLLMSKYSVLKTPASVMRELAQKTQQLRKKTGISQLELSKRSGVSYGSLKRFETSGQISLESLLKLAYFFDRLDDFTPVFQIDVDLEKVEKLFSDQTR